MTSSSKVSAEWLVKSA